MTPKTQITEMTKETGYYTLADLIEVCDDKEEFLWEGIIPRVGIVGMVGPSESGKSTFCRQLGLSIAAKLDSFLGIPLKVTHRSVFYLSTEDSMFATKKNTLKQLEGLGIAVNDVMGMTFNYDAHNVIARLDAYLIQHKVDLVVIDGWADCFRGSTNDLQQVREDLNKYDVLAKKYECCIMVLHHVGKYKDGAEAHKNNINGSQGFEGKCRLILDLRPTAPKSRERFLALTKGNDLTEEQKEGKYTLKLEDSRVLVNTGKTIKSGDAVEKVKFPLDEWLPRYANAYVAKKSMASAREYLLETHPEIDVPSVSWFKENQNKVVSHPRSLGDNTDRPDALDSSQGNIAA